MSRHLAVKLLSSYMDEEVTPAQLRLVEGHLSACTDCRRAIAGLRAVAAGVRRLEAAAPPPTLSAAVERRVRLASREEPGRFRLEDGLKRWVGQPVLAPAFAIILALGAILYLFAFGVSRSGPHTTRLVVAAAPVDEDTHSLEKPAEFRTDSEVPAPKTDLDPLGAAVGSATSEVRELAGRRFVQKDGIWVEVGLEGEPALEVLDLRLDSVRLEVELSAFRDLGRVRLRIDDRVVEVIYAAAASRD